MKKNKYWYWSELYFIGEDNLSKDQVEEIKNDPEYIQWITFVEEEMKKIDEEIINTNSNSHSHIESK